MKRIGLVSVLTFALMLVFATSAFANWGPHGGYSTDTDACAGCHRAHTSFSQIQYKPKDPGSTLPGDYPYALLVGNQTSRTAFCQACHGADAVGASTNVVEGVFDASPSTAGGAQPNGTTTLYKTNSTLGDGLNGGGFARAWDPEASAFQPSTSYHNMSDNADQPLWGVGSSPENVSLSCSDCHDPHGSSNYRLLKDTVNNEDVRLFVFGDDDPVNYPYADGWLRGADGGAAQMNAYVPNYTGGTKIAMVETERGTLSDWCAACHTEYVNRASAYDYETAEAGGAVNAPVRHRHPMNVAPGSGDSILQVEAMSSTNAAAIAARALIPLERDIEADPAEWRRTNRMGCLTCHYAHGSSQDMSGWASAELSSTTPFFPERNAARGGVDPTFNSALLRADNRGVCQRCHEK